MECTTVKETPKETAKEFVGHLTDEKYRANQLRWIFRGVQDATYQLLPKTHRDPWPFHGTGPKDSRDQLYQEFCAVDRFYEAAYYEGLPIPDWKSTTEWLGKVRRNFSETRETMLFWPAGVIAPLMAIAQHYGTPTRFLDWTRDALIAAYFAVADPDQHLPKAPSEAPSHVAVWILDTDVQVTDDYNPIPVPLREWYRTRIIQIPYDLNQNARAQRGVFLNHLKPDQVADVAYAPPLPHNPDEYPPLEKLLEDHKVGHALEKITLPVSQAAALLRELHHRKIDGAALFPGYLGAARAERERMRWEEVDPTSPSP